MLGLCDKFYGISRLEPSVIGGVARCGVTYCRTVVYKHIIGNLIAGGIVPTDKFVARTRCSGGAYRASDRISIGITPESSDFIVRGIFPFIAVLNLTDIGLCNAARKSCVVGVYAFLCLGIGISRICGNQISACIIPTLKGEAVLCSCCSGNCFIGFGVV